MHAAGCAATTGFCRACMVAYDVDTTASTYLADFFEPAAAAPCAAAATTRRRSLVRAARSEAHRCCFWR